VPDPSSPNESTDLPAATPSLPRDGALPAQKSLLRRHPLVRELVRDQLAIVLLLLFLAPAAGYWQHGYLPGADRPFPLAGVTVPIWQLLWLGFWTGYVMALVGEAAGILALPYAVSVLGFDTLAVTPTHLVITAINPYGALLGFSRERRWNVQLALWPCLGAVLGSQLGPFVRVHYLADPALFKAILGLGLLCLGAHLLGEIARKLWQHGRNRSPAQARSTVSVHRVTGQGTIPVGGPPLTGIRTVARSCRQITLRFQDEQYVLSPPLLLCLGAGVSLVSSAVGVGGGFLMTPLLVAVFRLPIHVVVAASIPFVMIQSMLALAAYGLTVPWLAGKSVGPEWAWSLFVASTAVLGAWCGAKSQRYVPETHLQLLLGLLTCLGGLAYTLTYFLGVLF
jgi:uncharacterized membrane protein YfcA